MPKKTAKPKGKKPGTRKPASRAAGGTVFNVQGNINVKGDFIGRDQTNYYYQTRQTFHITTPAQFMDELQRLREEIEQLKSRPEVDKDTALGMQSVQTEIDNAMDETRKDKPAVERIKDTLDSARETMDKLGGSIASAVNLGTTLGNLALLAVKVFGG